MADVKQLAVAILHGMINIAYEHMPSFTFDPDMILIDEFNVGQPSQEYRIKKYRIKCNCIIKIYLVFTMQYRYTEAKYIS